MHGITRNKIIRLSHQGFTPANIARDIGCDEPTVLAVLDGEVELAQTLEWVGRQMLRRCPRDRTPEEHRRIVEANFGVVD
jgi:hypothetical protein